MLRRGKRVIFHSLARICGKTADQIFTKIFIKGVSFDYEVQLNFRSHPDPS